MPPGAHGDVSSATAGGGWIGATPLRVEDEALLRGRGRFIDDLSPVPGAMHLALVRSPFAHAGIRGIDTAAALASPGTLAVLTGADLAAVGRPLGSVIRGATEHHVVAVDVARYAGEPVAVVVAQDRYLAEDAAELVDVDYEPLDAIVDPQAAAEAGHMVSDRSFRYGDPETALAAADAVVRGRFPFGRWTATPVECFGVVADWDCAADSLTVWANFQGPFTLHTVAAGALGLPAARLRLHTPPDSGGSFGVKAGVFGYVVLAGLVSKLCDVPVRWIEDRVEHLAAAGSATHRITDVEAGFAADGELLALRYDVIEDVGAYLRAPEPATLYRMHGSLTGAYGVRNVAVRNRVVHTNRSPTGLNRGFGGPQLYLALERIMARGATRLGLDPVAVARRNLVPPEAFPYRTPTGGLYDSGDYAACLDDAIEAVDYEGLRRRQAERRAGGDDRRRPGIGLACVVEPSISNMGYISLAETAAERSRGWPKSGNAEGATLAMNPLGGVTVRLSTVPQGQGHRTVAAQVAADALGLSPGEVEVQSEMDTHVNAWTVSSGNYSSRFAGIGVAAVAEAAAQLAGKLRRIAGDVLECAPADVELVDGQARVVGQPDRGVSLRRLAGAAHWNPESLPDGLDPGLAVTAFVSAPNLDPPNEADEVAASAAHGFVVDVAAVEVEVASGEVRILDYVTVHDAGTLLHPRLVDGQILGSFAHGLGPALLEQTVHDEEGNLLTGSFMDYLCATSAEVPGLRILHRCTPSPFTPLGAKGLGEGNTMSAPAALVNAVCDALGIDDLDLPLTAPRIWEALAAGGSEVTG
ncbi:MAG: xanthine dehydrogenase family protein molybdopterin-binding subunit [bacterium]|nr:xanthine dehydrogenase family protein molybdopterin-binding subunit [bacterium]